MKQYTKKRSSIVKEKTCFDIIISATGWVFGWCEGCTVELIFCCAEKKSEDNFTHEISAFFTEMEHGFSIGQEDVEILEKLL
jgi:exosome complex RNA-binding protein Rrp4